jgi:predicted RNase H-related nuclease YkuK (DUF458 family)
MKTIEEVREFIKKRRDRYIALINLDQNVISHNNLFIKQTMCEEILDYIDSEDKK